MIVPFFAAMLSLTPVAAQEMPTPAPTAAPVPDAKGATKQTAYKVDSIREEYVIMRKLGLEMEVQSLIIDDDGHPYDVLEGKDPKTGEKRAIWFDIKSFYGKGF